MLRYLLPPSTARKRARKFSPNRLRQELAFLCGGLLKKLVRQEIGSLCEGDEENAVEDFLRNFDGLEHRKLWPFARTRQEVHQPFAQALVLAIQLIRDVLVGAVGFPQQALGRAAKKPLRRKQKPQACVLFRFIEPREIEHLVGIATTAETVKANFDAVRDKHPFRAGRIDGVIPRLLHWAPASPWHDLVEVVRFLGLSVQTGQRCPWRLPPH